jgi:hypothetical protein
MHATKPHYNLERDHTLSDRDRERKGRLDK